MCTQLHQSIPNYTNMQQTAPNCKVAIIWTKLHQTPQKDSKLHQLAPNYTNLQPSCPGLHQCGPNRMNLHQVAPISAKLH